VEFGTDISDLDPSSYDAYIFLDFSNRARLSSKLKESYRLPSTLIVNIDHHHSNDYFGGLNYVDTRKPSTCSVLLEMFKALNVPIDDELSNRLMLGICTDSNFFAYPDNALMDAAFLVEHGADYNGLMLKNLRLKTPLNVKKYHALLIANLRNHDNFAYSTVSQKEIQALNLNPAEVRMGISALQDIEEFDFVFSLAEFKSHIKGSFRSRTNVDVSMFAIRLGGGGHKNNAGFTLEPMPLKDAVAKVLAVIETVGVNRYE
jgi:phosphoesterase RecJ-like protein